MENLEQAWTALQLGGPVVYPLLALALLSAVILVDKAFVYWRYARLPRAVSGLLERDTFTWRDLEDQMGKLGPKNYVGSFLRVILETRSQPAWWAESRAGEQAQRVEQALGTRLWILETTVTAAPLLGLLGTITGMMNAFKIISASGLVEPAGITGGVAQALIATAAGILIALVALFGFNLFSRLQSQILDDMQRLGTRLADHIRLDQLDKERSCETAQT